MHQMDKFLMAARTLEEAKGNGMLKYYPLGRRIPAGRTVVLVEGEKKADALQQLLDEHLWPEPLYYGSRTARAMRAANSGSASSQS